MAGRSGTTGIDPGPAGCKDINMRLRVTIEVDEDGIYVAECPSLPGCISQGRTRAEALANIKDAVQGYLASLKKHGEPIPPPISEDVIEVNA
jgi:antitoxin HicB